MKQAIVGFGIFMMILLTIAIVMALGKNRTEENLCEQAVELAIYQSLEEGIKKGIDPGAAFEINLYKVLEENSVEIVIHESDLEKGILSVTVYKQYENFGETRTVEVTRTVIYERELYGN